LGQFEDDGAGGRKPEKIVLEVCILYILPYAKRISRK
jgi:hypothetical protein